MAIDVDSRSWLSRGFSDIGYLTAPVTVLALTNLVNSTSTLVRAGLFPSRYLPILEGQVVLTVTMMAVHQLLVAFVVLGFHTPSVSATTTDSCCNDIVVVESVNQYITGNYSRYVSSSYTGGYVFGRDLSVTPPVCLHNVIESSLSYRIFSPNCTSTSGYAYNEDSNFTGVCPEHIDTTIFPWRVSSGSGFILPSTPLSLT
jgi:hypothetical protein